MVGLFADEDWRIRGIVSDGCGMHNALDDNPGLLMLLDDRIGGSS
jgi:hypothetical protein